MEEIYEFLLESGVSEEICQKVRDALDAKLQQSSLEMQVENRLLRAGAKSVKAAKALLHMEAISAEDGTLRGIDEEIARIKRECPYLFGAAVAYQPQKGRMPADVSQMSDKEYFDYIKTVR
jgi:hypothetical protein